MASPRPTESASESRGRPRRSAWRGREAPRQTGTSPGATPRRPRERCRLDRDLLHPRRVEPVAPPAPRRGVRPRPARRPVPGGRPRRTGRARGSGGSSGSRRPRRRPPRRPRPAIGPPRCTSPGPPRGRHRPVLVRVLLEELAAIRVSAVSSSRRAAACSPFRASRRPSAAAPRNASMSSSTWPRSSQTACLSPPMNQSAPNRFSGSRTDRTVASATDSRLASGSGSSSGHRSSNSVSRVVGRPRAGRGS